jgi:hypothetical protein
MIVLILSSLLIIFLLYYTYKYLQKLESTKCGIKHKKEIDVLKNMELYLIFMNIISAIILIFGFKKIKFSINIAILIILFNIIFASFFVYYVYNLYHKMPQNCYKTGIFPRYYLYLQAISYLISLFLIAFIGIFALFHK